jgi:hypothetical protein
MSAQSRSSRRIRLSTRSTSRSPSCVHAPPKSIRNPAVVTICTFGKMSYFAARLLAQKGFNVRSYSGGIKGSIDPRSPAKLPTA